MPLLAVLLVAAPGPAAPPSAWDVLEPGLELALFDGPPGGAGGDGKIAVIRIDPARFELRLLNASAPGQGQALSARRWADKGGAAAVINASMYQQDYRTSVSLMKSRDHVNQRRVSKDQTVLAFDPVERGLPPVHLIDRECEPLDQASQGYGAAVQSIRLVSCQRKNVWAPSPRRTSVAAVGVDGHGRVLFIHARTAWPVHDVVNALLALPIDLARAMYVEGGPEAQLFARSGGREVERLGAFEASPDAQNRDPWPVPNVLAAVRRAR
ncbi:MAG: phosphodiester glycosidase family protein [Anaeromyxobacter sp.]